MKYNFKKIGEIIVKERKAAGYKSQDDLIQQLKEYGYSISRNTLSKIEQGNTNHYDCELLFLLCEIFDCEMGYLLGEYECKTGRNTDIVNETGLNEDAVNKLLFLNSMNKAHGLSDVLSLFITHPKFIDTLELLSNNADGKCETVSFGKSHFNIDRRAVINSELKDTIINIATDIRKKHNLDPYSMYYGFAYSLHAQKRITDEQLQEIIEEYDKGNYEFVPKDLNL